MGPQKWGVGPHVPARHPVGSTGCFVFMRIRTVKPAFWSHPVMSTKDDTVRLAAIGLLNYADDEGFFSAHPSLIRSSLWPFDDDSTKVRRCLDELSGIGYISIKKHPEQGEIGHIEKFSDHQRVDRANPSNLKGYYFDDRSTIVRRSIAAVREGKVKEGNGDLPPADEDPGKPRERNLPWEALATLDGWSVTSQLTEFAGGRVGVALKQIKAVCPEVTPEEIGRRIRNYRLRYPDAPATSTAISSNWALCDTAPQAPTKKKPLLL